MSSESKENPVKTWVLLITELIRWVVIIIPVYLSSWRFAEVKGYTKFIEGWNLRVQFWVVLTGIFLLSSIVFYLPLKIIYLRFRIKVGQNTQNILGWRPSIVMYLLFCALPCLVLLWSAASVRRQAGSENVMGTTTTVILQVVVIGLTLTEWLSKLRVEVITYDLVAAMSVDFFFAYDVIEILMMSAYEPHIYNGYWYHVTFTMALVAMVKYVPAQIPYTDDRDGAPRGAVACILTSVLCNDVPFVVVRVTTIAQYGLRASDLIHPLKNVALIVFGVMQVYIIHRNRAACVLQRRARFDERRRVRVYSKRRCETPVNSNYQVTDQCRLQVSNTTESLKTEKEKPV